MNINRRTLLQSIPAAALLSATDLAASSSNQPDAMPNSATVYELRIYHVIEGKLPAVLARFRDHTIAIFDRHNMRTLAFWTPTDDPQKSNTLVYILVHPSREAADANWKSFRVDPEWISVRDQSEAAGKLVEKIDSTFLALTDFSPPIS
jgi:hypothetical protein